MSNDDSLPDPRPPAHLPPISDLSFAALGWLFRAAQATGAGRFSECVTPARFYLENAASHASTPAEVAVVTGLASSLEGLIKADAGARELLGASLVDFDAAFEAGCLPAETESAEFADGIEPQEHDASQDPAAGSREA